MEFGVCGLLLGGAWSGETTAFPALLLIILIIVLVTDDVIDYLFNLMMMILWEL